MLLKRVYGAKNSIELLPPPPKSWDYKWTPLFFFFFLISGKPQRVLIKSTDSKIPFPLVACRTAISLKDTIFDLNQRHRSDCVVGWEPAYVLYY